VVGKKMNNVTDQYVNDFLVVDPSVKEILDLMLGENCKASGNKIRLFAKRLFPKNCRGKMLAAKLLRDIRTGTSSLTTAERLELLELLVTVEHY
jgi:hypothetical protein